MSTSCVENNKISSFPGVVFLDGKSALKGTNDNFGDQNTGKFLDCKGFFKDTLQGQCSVFDASSCPLLPQPNITCFSDWKALSQAISKSIDGGVFTICKNTILDVSRYPEPQITPIQINVNEIVIQCGSNAGDRGDNCTVIDGDYQFRITAGTGIEFRGITFANAGLTSVSIEQASSSVDVTFQECTFNNNIGSAVVSVLDTASSAVRASSAVTLTFLLCLLEKNKVSKSVIQNSGGNLYVLNSIFTANTSGEHGTVFVDNKGTLSLDRSCFFNNENTNAPGTLVITGGSTLATNRQNFAQANTNGGSCTDLFISDDGSPSCIIFPETQCQAARKDPFTPTATPTRMQPSSPAPMITPTSTPTSSQPIQPTPQPGPKPFTPKPFPVPKPQPFVPPTNKPTKKPFQRKTNKPTRLKSFSYSYSHSYSHSYPQGPPAGRAPSYSPFGSPSLNTAPCPQCPVCPGCPPCPECPPPPCPDCPTPKDKSKSKKSKKGKGKGKKDGKKGPKVRRERRQ